ncbi:MAG: membrane protein insertase YidC [Candidatus Lernaella stagnicola]|nr:membrane protein insertase YidC [Candidatus Lernaella stagnicola]
MDRNFVIAMVLMILVLVVWQGFFTPDPPPPAEDMTPAGDAPTASPTPASSPATADTAEPMQTPPPLGTPTPLPTPTPAVETGTDSNAAPAAPQAVGLFEKNFSGDLVSGSVTNAESGSVRRWNLLKYFQTTEDADKPEPERLRVNLAPYARPVVKKKVAPQDYADQDQLVCALHQMQGLSGKEPWQEIDQDSSSVTLSRQAGALTVTKTIRFRPRGNTPQELPYNIDVEMEIANAAGQTAVVQPFCAVYDQIIEDNSSFFYRDYNQPLQINYVDGSLEAKHIAKVEPDDVPPGATYWTGFADNYFAALVGPDQESFPVQNARAQIKVLPGNVMEARLLAEPLNIPAGSSKKVVFKAYLGPKKREFISAGNNGPKFHFDKSIDFGWFDVIARYLMYALIFFAGLTHNYGVAIILVTVIIKVFMFPLQHKSFKSMRQMAKLQPEIAKLKEKFKDEKEKLNQEMMALYRVHKVNPAGGCLPMLLQLPIFIAFYRALGFAIELRHTPFMFWLQDLSAQDPYFITPLLMGVSMFLSQRMTPSTADPAQQRIMMMMPVIFTFLFLSFPAGLVLYWLTNNILSILQQVVTNKYFGDDPAPAQTTAGGK